MWYKQPIKDRMNLMKLYKKAYPDFSYKDMVSHFNDEKELEQFGNGGKKPIVDNTIEQKQWLQKYVKSPMYIDRLKQEGFTNPKNEQNIRLNNLNQAQPNYVKAISKNPGFISGMYIPKKNEGFHRSVSYEYENDWIPNKWVKDNIKHLDKKGQVYLENEYKPGKNPYFGFETTPLHEFGHAVDDGGNRIPEPTINKIKSFTNNDNLSKTIYKTNKGVEFDYLNTPTEFINRLQPIRYLLDKSKIYDAKTEKFTEKHYDKMINDPNIKYNVHYDDVMKVLKGNDKEKKKNFINMMNTIANNKTNQNNIQDLT